MSTVARPEVRTTAPTILVIDDAVSVQRFAARALTGAGYRVLVAADVQEALNLAAAEPSGIDLALIDVMLPSGNGVELATELLTKHRETLLVYMSGFPADAIQAVQHEGGPDGGFLEKPFSAQALMQRIQELLPFTPNADSLPFPPEAPPTPATVPDRTATASNADAVYRLESPVRCPHCGENVSALKAVRLLRTLVNFTSTLPRRGRVLICPGCLCVMSAELTNF
ncbi:MAG: response regulator [Vicinamibacterales bacterium]